MTKDPRDKRGNSVDSRGEIEVRRPQWPWAPRLEMDGAVIPYDASIWDTPRGHANYLAQALQQPFFLPRDMDSIRRTKQPDLFMSLKRDLAMVMVQRRKVEYRNSVIYRNTTQKRWASHMVSHTFNSNIPLCGDTSDGKFA